MRKRMRTKSKPVDLDVTAFMNLMVILVPCLLSLAVFTHISILQLNIPGASAPSAAQPKQPSEVPEVIEVTLRKDLLTVGTSIQGILHRFPLIDGKYDFAGLSRLMQNMKDRAQDKKDVSLLVEQDIPYESVVHAMDTLRMAKIGVGFSTVKRELFPDIAIGDAPPRQ